MSLPVVSPGRELLGWVALAALLTAVLPLFLCMPLWCDCNFFDCCAWTILRGDLLYRDVFVQGFPGIVLAQTGIRAALGWRIETLRFFDFLIVSGTIWMLVRRVLPEAFSRDVRVWTAVVLALFYFSTTEANHCQPDGWMFLPAVFALHLRQRQEESLLDTKAPWLPLARRGLLEGVAWGLAFTIKPFVCVPALACFVLSLCLTARKQALPRLLLDAGSVLSGGLLVGVGSVGWLWASGNLPYFLDNWLGGWNSEYFRYSMDWRTRTYLILHPHWPWGLVHFFALPIALAVLGEAIARRDALASGNAEPARRALLAVFYLGWFYQANYVQQQFAYHLVPTIMLGITLLAQQQEKLFSNRLLRWLLIPGFGAWVLAWHPLLSPERLAVWPRCWREGASPAVRNKLTLDPYPIAADWVALAEVAQFLREQHIKDRQLTCYSASTLALYRELNVKQSTRWVMLTTALHFFRSRKEEILREVRESPEIYVVTDERTEKLEMKINGLNPDELDPKNRIYPWTEPILFRSGRYRVHRIVPDYPASPR